MIVMCYQHPMTYFMGLIVTYVAFVLYVRFNKKVGKVDWWNVEPLIVAASFLWPLTLIALIVVGCLEGLTRVTRLLVGEKK